MLLATALVYVSTADGSETAVRAMIDQGSESCFVAKSVVQRLRAAYKPANVIVHGIGAMETGRINAYAELIVRGQFANSPSIKVKALIMNKVTSSSPQVDENIKSFSHFHNLKFADENSANRPIELLLGAEVFSVILKPGVRIGKENQPVAQETSFGWIVSGKINQTANYNASAICSSLHVSCFEKLVKSVEKFWLIEEVPTRHYLSADDMKCESIFRTTTIRRSDGRYEIRIPFKNEKPELADSYNHALAMYRKLEGRFRRDPELAEMYHAFLTEYLKMGHMAPESAFSDNPEQRYFTPHHPVLRPSARTTKLRVVFNASSKTSNGNSLNDCMLVGPKLHQELFDIVLRWRMWKYVCCADIEKMFRQISVAPQDTPYQCILWKPPGSDQVQIFRLTTVTYGTASAPYLSMRVLQQLARDEAERFPNASPVLLRDTFVDDVVFGADTKQQCRVIRDELIGMLKSGGFPLRKWESNTEDLLSDLPVSLRARDPEKEFDDDSSKILGIHWRRRDDVFSFQVDLTRPAKLTKRTVLSTIASLFDPLGWVSPSVIIAKIFMQKLWREQLDWDAILPEDLSREWTEYFNDLKSLQKISIPRWTHTFSTNRDLEIHAFCDASTRAYAAVVYLKCRTKTGWKISLLASKTRVAPLKELTVPRLELSGAVLLAELLAHVRDTLQLQDVPCFCWTDSTIALSWVQTCPSKLKKFVANRVWDIQEKIPCLEWRHVPTECNPADAASRGVSPCELVSHTLWWSGPSWLHERQEAWPNLSSPLKETEIPELKTHALTAKSSTTDDVMSALAEKYSSWNKLLLATACLMRWAARKMEKRVEKRDNAPEKSLSMFVRQASDFWLKHAQSKLFPTEISLLLKGKTPAQNPLKGLDVFIDQKGLLRAGGRLSNAELPYDALHPILLGKHYITILIIRQIHHITLHGNLQIMRRVLREKYFIFKVRDLVKACVKRCVTCVRFRGAPCTQKMGDLPKERSTPGNAFSRTGVDYAGPFQLKDGVGRGKKTRKGYIAVFVCLASRAIHLETVSDLTTNAFLAAFRRFSSIYGVPSLMTSDNASNFQGAKNELRRAFEKVRKDKEAHFALEGVEWRFIPPSAPNFGGIWEAGVKSMKHHLKRVINNQTLTFEEMQTLVYQISACLNSRPLAPLKDSLDDFSYSTPGLLLGRNPVASVPEPDESDTRESHLTRWKRVMQMRDQFWRMWRHDYLLQLQTRRKWQTASNNLVVGDIVLIRSDVAPPSKWELGRVIECYPGKDGLVRVVKIKTAKSTFNRAVSKICLLPLRTRAEGEANGVIPVDEV